MIKRLHSQVREGNKHIKTGRKLSFNLIFFEGCLFLEDSLFLTLHFRLKVERSAFKELHGNTGNQEEGDIRQS